MNIHNDSLTPRRDEVSNEVKDILTRIFPNLIQISKDKGSEETLGPILISEPEMPTLKCHRTS